MEIRHVYDLTEYFDNMVKAKKITGVGDNCYKHGYFVCHDVWDTHICRIQVGINSEYEEESRTKIIETENIHHSDLTEFCIKRYGLNKDILDTFDKREVIEVLIAQIGLKELLKAIVAMDYENGFEGYDVDKFRYDTSLETLINRIDGGYGITKIQLDIEDSDKVKNTNSSKNILDELEPPY